MKATASWVLFDIYSEFKRRMPAESLARLNEYEDAQRAFVNSPTDDRFNHPKPVTARRNSAKRAVRDDDFAWAALSLRDLYCNACRRPGKRGAA